MEVVNTPCNIPEIRLDRSKISVHEIGDDSDVVEYWRNTTTKQRLQHAERLRRIAYGSRATERLQRVIEVVRG
jgi:hypothetical protein